MPYDLSRPAPLLLILAVLEIIVVGIAAAPSSAAALDGPSADGEAPRFVDVTAASGVDFVHDNGATGEKWMPETMGSGVVIFDADNDGHLDLFFVNGKALDPAKGEKGGRQALYLNRGDGTFADAGRESGADLSAYCLGGAAGDVDNDGDHDLFLACLGRDLLLRNDGGRFTEVGREAGLVDDYEFGAGAAFFDADNDGFLDLLVSRYVEWTAESDIPCFGAGEVRTYCTPENYPGAAPRFYRNRGDGTFEERTRRAGFFQPAAKGLGVTVLDLENDGRLDAAIACDTSPNLLFQNRGRGLFSEIGLLAGMAVADTGEAKGGMGIDAADVDGGGLSDLVISYFAGETVGLYRNEGDGLFTDTAPRAALGAATRPMLGWGTFFFDYDLDGRLDLLVVNGHLDDVVPETSASAGYRQPAQLFHRREQGLVEVSESHGGDLAVPRVGRGAAYGDLDGDGDLDVVLTANGGPAAVFENRGLAAGHRALRVALVGDQSQRQGIGARVEVSAGGKTQSWLVRTGGSYLSQSQIEPVFGLGTHARAERVVVHWPSGAESVLENVASGQRLVIHESAAAGESVPEENEAADGTEKESTAETAPPDDAAEESAASPNATERDAVLHNRALAHLAEGRFTEAAAAWREALDVRAAPELEYNLALSLFRGREFEAALEALEGLETTRATVLRARALRAMGRQQEAFDAWQKALSDGALDVASLWHVVRLLQLAARYDEGVEVLAELAPAAMPEARATLATEQAEMLAGSGRLDEAFEALDRALPLADEDPETLELLAEARAARQGGDKAEATTLISIVTNLLRATEEHQRVSQALLVQGPGSPLSDAPLPLPSAPRPGPAPSPLAAAGPTLEAAGAHALCTTGDGLLLTGERTVRLAGDPAEGWTTVAEWDFPARECASADLDVDGHPEWILLGNDAVRVIWGGEPTTVEPTVLEGVGRDAAIFDSDLDGDADLAIFGERGARLWRNNRDRSFTLIELPVPATPLHGGLASDFDGDGAAELWLIPEDGPGVLVGGLQEEKPAVVEHPGLEARGAAARADLDHDGDLDLLGAGQWLAAGQGGAFKSHELSATATARRLGTADLDGDGVLDLLTLEHDGRFRLLRGLGQARFGPWPGGEFPGVSDAAVVDLDGDHRLELVLLADGEARFLHAAEAVPNLAVDILGTKDNPDGLGSRIELWAGRLYQQREVRHSTHELGESGRQRHFGLGGRNAAEWLRVTWPNRTWASDEGPPAGAVEVEQAPDLVGSCPFLYAHDGERFAFVTDLLGGAPLGLPVARGVDMPTDPEEYVFLAGERLAERDGLYELRIAVELREILYLDQVELLIVDHPAEAAIATDDGLRGPPFPPFELYATLKPLAPIAAIDHRGNDVLDRVLEIDGRYPDDFEWIAYQGYAEPHSLTLEFERPEPGMGDFLIVTGGYYWSEADHLALDQSTTVASELPRLELWDGTKWHTLADPMPFPGGRSKTIAVDLGGRLDALPPGPVRLRIRSNLRLYFDRVLLAGEPLDAADLRLVRQRPASAEARFRGYSSRGEFDGRLPPPYDYHRVEAARPYPRFAGFFTLYGDVRPLLEESDNAAVVLHHGEEIALTFEAPPPPPAGFERDFLLKSVGWDKDGDPNVRAGTTVLPLPFHGMRGYPSTARGYPWTPELRELDRRYRQRFIAGR